jgi:hypothetical protein
MDHWPGVNEIDPTLRTFPVVIGNACEVIVEDDLVSPTYPAAAESFVIVPKIAVGVLIVTLDAVT